MTGYKDPPKEHQWKKGQSGNAGGRPKNTLKDHVRQKLNDMTSDEKDEWLKTHKISGDIQWKMSEGSPHQTEETKIDANITIVAPSAVVDKLHATHQETGNSNKE